MPRKDKIKEYFTFTKGERDGILVLIFVIIIAIFANIYSDIFVKEKDYNFSKFEADIAEFEKNLVPVSGHSYKTENAELLKYDTINLFKFDPNNTSSTEFKDIGLSEKQIRTISNYLSKGGKFRYKSDFKKIYGIPENQYNILYPYIDLPLKISENEMNNTYYSEHEKDITSHTELFYFDPNTTTDEEWMMLGFSEKQVSVIRKYINNGGKFQKKEDLKKIYIISDEKYNELSSFIKIEKKNTVEDHFDNFEKKEVVVDINNLSEKEFKELGGFWKYNAVGIIKYRNLLGGYRKKEQLLEVYSVKKYYYDKITENIIIDKQKIQKININFAEVSELGRHPYISYNDAKKIIDFRNKNGSFKQLNDLTKNNIISKRSFEKISPYLKVK